MIDSSIRASFSALNAKAIASNGLLATGTSSSDIYLTPRLQDGSEIGLMRLADYLSTNGISWYNFMIPDTFATGSTGYATALLVTGSSSNFIFLGSVFKDANLGKNFQ